MLAFNERSAAGATTASPAEVAVLVVVDGQIVAADPKARRLVGAKARRQVVGRDVSDFLAPGWTGTEPTVDMRPELATMVRLDGRLEVVECTSTPERWEGREATRLSLWRLVTDPVRIRQIATGLAVLTADAVIVADTRFGIRSFSPAAEALYRSSEADVLGRGLTDVVTVTSSGAGRELGSVLQQLRCRGYWHGRAVQRRRHGGCFAAHLTATVVRDGGGKDVGTVWVVRPSDAGDDPLDRLVADEGALAAEIPRALARREFTVRYQPIIGLETHRVVELQASLHWRHPDRGLLPAGYVLGRAAPAGATSALTRLLIEDISRQRWRWSRSGDGMAVAVAVNLSAAQLADERVPGWLASALAEPATRGWIEVPEADLATDIHVMAERLRQCDGLGLAVAVDDFGIGYPSLPSLRRLPVRRLKTPAGLLSPALMVLAGELGVDVVATDVDNPDDLDRARQLGCRFGQGDLLGRAQPPEQLRLGS
ncbi:MAG TPA: EAL domain-containing protein [Acidimicrobiia bacterium]